MYTLGEIHENILKLLLQLIERVYIVSVYEPSGEQDVVAAVTRRQGI